MKSILFVHHGAGIGGASINLRSVVRSFENKGYNLTVLLLQDSEAKKLFLVNNKHVCACINRD